MKNCLKYITLLFLTLAVTTPAWAGGQFIPLNPEKDTLIYGKKFIGLGGGQDPIELTRIRSNYYSLRKQAIALRNDLNALEKISQEPSQPTEQLAELPAKGQFIPSPPVKEEEIASLTPELPPIPSPQAAISPSPQENVADGELHHLWPVDETVPSTISSRFGFRMHPITGHYGLHEGVDIAAPVGTAILASERGKVTDIGTHKNLGKYVKIAHEDGSYSLYGHLSKITVAPGKSVKRGEKIGELGSSGRSTGPHLDYSLRVGGRAVNPLAFLKHRDETDVAQAD